VLLLGVGLNGLIQAGDLVQTADQKVLAFVARARTPALTPSPSSATCSPPSRP
jgi:hypothetical protein